jgi:TP901 family phage tail tape measure protein
MATQTSSLIVRLIDGVTGPAGKVRRSLLGLQGVTGQAGGMMAGNIGMFTKSLALIGGAVGGIYGIQAGLRSAVSAASEFESAMADVRKVVDFPSPAAFQEFQQSIIDMSKRLPMSAQALSQIVAAAGQAGIANSDLLRFTELAAKVGVAFDISADQTGESLAKMMTGLNLTVDQVGALSDAMNHLSNAQASSAADILEVVRRAGADGKMFGFSAVQTSAFASAMLSAGSEADVAATSFRNMGRALVRGSAATKTQRTAFKALGLDARKVAKRMQEDAVGTTVDVMERINALPKHLQSQTASALFGDEARALMPLVSNLDLLKKSLGLVADETKYLGSAQREYEVRSKTFANNVQLFRNNIEALSIAVGNLLMPALNSLMQTAIPVLNKFADVMSTLDQRVTVFDDISAAMRGFISGLGIDGVGTLTEALSGLFDAVFGRTQDFEADVTAMSRIFEQFRAMGAAVREFGEAIGSAVSGIESFLGIEPGTVAEIMGTVASFGFKLAAASVGISMVAGALMSLGRAILFVTGISTVGKLAGILRVLMLGTGAAGVAGVAAGAAGGAARAAGGSGLLGLLWRGRAAMGAMGAAGAAGYGLFAPMLNPSADSSGAAAGGRADDRDRQKRADALKAQLADVEAKIAQIRASGRADTEAAQARLARYEEIAAGLRSQIEALNGLTVKPQIDGSSIDDAMQKVQRLSSMFQSLGSVSRRPVSPANVNSSTTVNMYGTSHSPDDVARAVSERQRADLHGVYADTGFA